MDSLRQYIAECLQELAENQELDEFSGAGAVAGMTLPLGMSPPVFKVQSRRRKKKKRKDLTIG